MQKSNVYRGFVLLMVLIFIAGCAEQTARDIIPNASFETEDDGRPAVWRTRTWQGKGLSGYDETGRTGTRSLSLQSGQGADMSWYAIIPVAPYSKYRFTGWIKTKDLQATSGRGALFNIHGFQNASTDPLTGTQDWTQVSMEFETGAHDAIHFNCLFGGWGFATGSAWYDDLHLELISTKPLNLSLIHI